MLSSFHQQKDITLRSPDPCTELCVVERSLEELCRKVNSRSDRPALEAIEASIPLGPVQPSPLTFVVKDGQSEKKAPCRHPKSACLAFTILKTRVVLFWVWILQISRESTL